MLDRIISFLLQMPGWLTWLAFLVFMLYIVAPLVVWQLQRFKTDRTLEEVDADNLPPVVDRYFLQLTPNMVALGFVVVAYLKDAKMQAGFTAYMTLWVNRGCGQSALIGAIVGPAAITPKTRWIEFQTELADGWKVETNNSNNLGMFVLDKKTDRCQFPGVEDPAQLYQLHLWHESVKLDPRKPRFVPADEAVIEHMTSDNQRTFANQAAAGRMKLVRGKYCHTLRNAFRCTWMLCPPIVQIRRARNKAQANRMKAEALARGPRRPIPVITTDVQLVSSAE